MNIDYGYIRPRFQFGCSYSFFSQGPEIIDYVPQDKNLAEPYVTKTFVDKATQEGPIMSLNEMNTWRPEFTDRGMFHDQGGWPKELNAQDDEAVLRYKKKLEREDNYIGSMRFLSKPMEHAVLQNNAINIYQKYFEDTMPAYSISPTLSQIRNAYGDLSSIKRSVSHVSWSPEKTTFAASYCNTKFQLMSSQESTEAYIWNVEIPSSPETTLNSNLPIVSLEWNPVDLHFLIGGLLTGQIALYDPRKAPEHVNITPDIVSHRDPVHSLLWTYSKTGVDFFSTSGDGIVKWWDARNLQKFTDSITLSFRGQTMSSSCLEYDSSIPAKYLVGTETGYVVCGNRKGVSLSEKLPWMIKTNQGPVYSLQRNGFFSKFYLTVGDWSARIWSEECKESAIMWTKPYQVGLTGGEWSHTRPSIFFLTRSDGKLDLWDLLLEQGRPYLSTKVTNTELLTLRVEESEGQFVIVGDDSGKCHLIQFAEMFATCLKNDKAILSTIFERESHREKILETRMRELRLAMKLKAQSSKQFSKMEVVDKGEEDKMAAEEEYWAEVNKTLNQIKEARGVKQTEKNQKKSTEDLKIQEKETEIKVTEPENR